MEQVRLLFGILGLLLLTACVGPPASPAASPTPKSQWTIEDASNAITSAGLEFASPRKMVKDDYGWAPMVATEGVRFLIPSLGTDKGGRLYTFANTDDRDTTHNYVVNLGRSSAAFFSWTFVKDNVLLQINGDLPEDQARRYEAALLGMK